MPPAPATLFNLANPLALLGWACLALSPLFPAWADRVAALLIPMVLAIAYTALVLVYWSGAEGGFSSLASVMALFTNPHIVLAGWLHYLAFDLFVGAWITRTARAEGIPHLFTLPCLALTFLFGPVGFLTFSALRAVTTLRHNATGAAR